MCVNPGDDSCKEVHKDGVGVKGAASGHKTRKGGTYLRLHDRAGEQAAAADQVLLEQLRHDVLDVAHVHLWRSDRE